MGPENAATVIAWVLEKWHHVNAAGGNLRDLMRPCRKGSFQQGMNDETHQARRYHWLCKELTSFVDAPHAAMEDEVMGTSLIWRIAKLTARAMDSSTFWHRSDPTTSFGSGQRSNPRQCRRMLHMVRLFHDCQL